MHLALKITHHYLWTHFLSSFLPRFKALLYSKSFIIFFQHSFLSATTVDSIHIDIHFSIYVVQSNMIIIWPLIFSDFFSVSISQNIFSKSIIQCHKNHWVCLNNNELFSKPSKISSMHSGGQLYTNNPHQVSKKPLRTWQWAVNVLSRLSWA